MIEHFTYRVQDHRFRDYLVSPVTGQLLSCEGDEEWRRLLANNCWGKRRLATSQDGIADQCRYPPDLDFVITQRGFHGHRSGLAKWWLSLRRGWLTPDSISARLGRRLVTGGGIEPALDAIGRLSPLPRGQCFFKSYQEALILHRHGVPFSLLYGLIVPSNLVHAWVEILTPERRAVLIDEFPGMVHSYQVSIEMQFRP